MSLETILGKVKKITPLVLASSILSCQKSCSEDNEIPHFEVKSSITDSNGVAKFIDDQNGEEVIIYVKSENSSGNGVADALVVFFDGDGSEAFYSEHPDYNTPDFQIYEHNSSHTLTLTSNTWQGWSIRKERDEGLHTSSRMFVDWATREKNNGWGYFGCSTFEDIEDERKLASVLYAGANKTSPFAAVNSVSETIRSILGIFVNDLEMYDAEDCEAFQKFGFIPNLSGWTSPTGGMLLNYCYTPESFEKYTDNGVDDDCDGLIDEIEGNGSNGNNGVDSGNNSNNGSEFNCSGNEYLCDDFNSGDFSEHWNFENGVPEFTDGKMRFVEPARAEHGFLIDLTTEHEYGFKLLSEVKSGEGYNIKIITQGSTGDFGSLQILNYESEIYAKCEGDSSGSTTMPLAPGENYQLEIAVSQRHSSVFINDNLLYSQDNCWPNLAASEEEDLLKLIISNSSDDGPEFDYISIDEF